MTVLSSFMAFVMFPSCWPLRSMRLCLGFALGSRGRLVAGPLCGGWVASTPSSTLCARSSRAVDVDVDGGCRFSRRLIGVACVSSTSWFTVSPWGGSPILVGVEAVVVVGRVAVVVGDAGRGVLDPAPVSAVIARGSARAPCVGWSFESPVLGFALVLLADPGVSAAAFVGGVVGGLIPCPFISLWSDGMFAVIGCFVTWLSILFVVDVVRGVARPPTGPRPLHAAG